MRNTSTKIIITGAAGLVGQNLILLLKKFNMKNIVAIDKHLTNTQLLKKIHPDIQVIKETLSLPGTWQKHIEEGCILILLHAQIGGTNLTEFVANNVKATKLILKEAKKKNAQFIVHVSSSVVNSKADDYYVKTKKIQEVLVKQSQIDSCIIRPTIMYGDFDRKHLGWLSRFIKRTPVFPIPGHGKYIRQPLFVNDFCHIIIKITQEQELFKNKSYNISGQEEIYYKDMIKKIRSILNAKTLIIYFPYSIFWLALKLYRLLDKNPPFTTHQLKALTIKETFEVIPWEKIFGVKKTSFEDGLKKTFQPNQYNHYILDF